MIGFFLGARSLLNLRGVHPDLVRVIKRAIEITTVDFTVLEGLRTEARQRQLVASGASMTMASRHLKGPDGYGHAVDIAPLIGGKVSWHWPHYDLLAPQIFKAAELEGVKIEWGGLWTSFKDGPHWQLPKGAYP